MAETKGHEYTRVSCRACGHTVELIGVGNALVGCHDRMRCTVCGSRGADIHRIYTQRCAPRASVVAIPRRATLK